MAEKCHASRQCSCVWEGASRWQRGSNDTTVWKETTLPEQHVVAACVDASVSPKPLSNFISGKQPPRHNADQVHSF
jgi:hypothetical protein